LGVSANPASENQVKLIIRPPPASNEDLKKERLL
jgi:hypothetical protein